MYVTPLRGILSGGDFRSVPDRLRAGLPVLTYTITSTLTFQTAVSEGYEQDRLANSGFLISLRGVTYIIYIFCLMRVGIFDNGPQKWTVELAHALKTLRGII